MWVNSSILLFLCYFKAFSRNLFIALSGPFKSATFIFSKKKEFINSTFVFKQFIRAIYSLTLSSLSHLTGHKRASDYTYSVSLTLLPGLFSAKTGSMSF